jgi:hypothetical protein
MRIKPSRATIAGSVVALAITVPAAQAYEVDAASHSTSSKAAQAQRLQAIKAQFKANAEFMKSRAHAAHALRASGWYTEAAR